MKVQRAAGCPQGCKDPKPSWISSPRARQWVLRIPAAFPFFLAQGKGWVTPSQPGPALCGFSSHPSSFSRLCRAQPLGFCSAGTIPGQQGFKSYKFCCPWGEQGAGMGAGQPQSTAPSPPLHYCLLAGVWMPPASPKQPKSLGKPFRILLRALLGECWPRGRISSRV